MTLSFRPVFIGWTTLLWQLPFQLFLTLWCGVFFGGMGVATGLFPSHSSGPFIFFGALAFFGIPAVVYFGKRMNYARTVYKFLDDRLEFEEGFLTINKKVIKYKDIKEITLRKGILQRLYGLGTIYLATLATGSSPYTNFLNVFNSIGFGNVSASGVALRDIREPDEAYRKIQSIVDSHRA